MNTENISF